MFIRGGVYRVVREALGGFFAKLAVSALMFDYLLTGPISSVSAGQYLVGLLFDTAAIINPSLANSLGLDHEETRTSFKRWGSGHISVDDEGFEAMDPWHRFRPWSLVLGP